MDDAAVRERLEANFLLLESFAWTWQQIATEQHPALARSLAVSPGPTTQTLDVGCLRLALARLPA
jgi:hypothetical protein